MSWASVCNCPQNTPDPARPQAQSSVSKRLILLSGLIPLIGRYTVIGCKFPHNIVHAQYYANEGLCKSCRISCMFYLSCDMGLSHVQCESKNPSKFFWHFFPKRLGIFSPNFTCPLYIPIYARLQIFLFNYLQLWGHCDVIIKCDHPACVSADGGQFEHMMWTGRSRLIWHNFVRVTDNWIKICILS